jgi:hypothetical protein
MIPIVWRRIAVCRSSTRWDRVDFSLGRSIVGLGVWLAIP